VPTFLSIVGAIFLWIQKFRDFDHFMLTKPIESIL